MITQSKVMELKEAGTIKRNALPMGYTDELHETVTIIRLLEIMAKKLKSYTKKLKAKGVLWFKKMPAIIFPPSMQTNNFLQQILL